MVYFGAHSHVGEITEDAMARIRETHYDFLGSFTRRSLKQPKTLFNLLRLWIIFLSRLYGSSRERARDAIFYSYTKHINGFAAHLDHDLALAISSKCTQGRSNVLGSSAKDYTFLHFFVCLLMVERISNLFS